MLSSFHWQHRFWLSPVHAHTFSHVCKQKLSGVILFRDRTMKSRVNMLEVEQPEREICSHADNLWASIWSALRPCWWSKFLTVGGRTVGCCPWEPLTFILLPASCIYLPYSLVSSERLTWICRTSITEWVSKQYAILRHSHSQGLGSNVAHYLLDINKNKKFKRKNSLN